MKAQNFDAILRKKNIPKAKHIQVKSFLQSQSLAKGKIPPQAFWQQLAAGFDWKSFYGDSAWVVLRFRVILFSRKEESLFMKGAYSYGM